MTRRETEFGVHLRRLRKTRGMSQEQLAERIGRKKMTISLWETGGNDPPQGELLNKIAEVLCEKEGKERSKLYQLASRERRTLPPEIVNICLEHAPLFDLLFSQEAHQYTDQEWEDAVKILKREHEKTILTNNK